jgi:hypothetical protein
MNDKPRDCWASLIEAVLTWEPLGKAGAETPAKTTSTPALETTESTELTRRFDSNRVVSVQQTIGDNA